MKSEIGRSSAFVGNTDLTGSRRRPRSNTRLRPVVFSILAIFGVFGGISALFVGIVFFLLHSLAAVDAMFDRVGTALLVVAIPMILIGAIFIDAIEEKND